MKFPQLPIGSRFSWKGGEYEKVGPVSAVSLTDGSQRLLPRSADVRLLATDGKSPVNTLDREKSLSMGELEGAVG